MLSNYLNAKKQKKNRFGMGNTQYSIDLSVHKHPRVFNKTYTIQSRVNCPNYSIQCCEHITQYCVLHNKTQDL